MIKCDAKKYQDDSLTEAFYQGQYYCPDFGEEDQLYQNYYYTESSWLRFEVQRCDPQTNNIPCASREDIDKYLFEKLVLVQVKQASSDLDSRYKVVKYGLENLLYSSAINAEKITRGQDINILQNEIELEDDIIGLMES